MTASIRSCARWLGLALWAGLAAFSPVRAQQAPSAGPQSWNPATADPGYPARKLRAVPPAAGVLATSGTSGPTRAAAPPVRPACFEPFDTTAAGGWTRVPREDDNSFGPVALGWNFSLLGTVYNKVYVNTNGNITFDAPLSAFTAQGFPISTPMVAAFWADVDTRGASSGSVWYKVFPDRLVVTWSKVGYYSVHADKKNTFQLVIKANTAPGFAGNDVLLSYDDMQWTTGDASGGFNGFGGAAATVGVNRGNGVDYVQTGRFNLNSAQAPNVPTAGTPGGVDWLDGLCLGYRVGPVGNVPPAVAGLPPGSTLALAQGQTQTVVLQFSGPEVNQTVSVVPALNGLCNATATVSGNNTANPTLTFTVTGSPCNAGTTNVSFAATDTGTPAGRSTFALAVVVSPPVVAPPVVPDGQWTGAVSTAYPDPANWSNNVLPTGTTNVVIPADAVRMPVLSAAAAANDLAVARGASLTVASGGALALNGNLANNGSFGGAGTLRATGPAAQTFGGSAGIGIAELAVGAAGVRLGVPLAVARRLVLAGDLASDGQLTLLSSAAGTALVVNSGGVATGPATVQRAIDPALNSGPGYRHYSAPVAGSTVADLATAGFAPVLNPAYNTSASPAAEVPFPTVYGYDQGRLLLANDVDPFNKGYFSPGALADPLVVGQGYTVNLGAQEVVDFVGVLNNGDLTLPLARNAGPTAPDAGWQLLGNPYPAPLDYSRVAPADRPNLDGAIYVNQSLGQFQSQYRAYVNGVGDGNPVLPVGQGFFVRVSEGQTSGSLTFRNGQRLTAPDGTAFQRGAADARPQVRLELRGATGPAADVACLYAENGATAGADARYDAVKLPNPGGLNLSTVSADGRALAIDGRPEFAARLAVLLQVRVPATGTYTLRAAQLLNLSGLRPYLRDWQLGTLTDLTQQAAYSFSQNAAFTGRRFELVFGTPQALPALPAALVQQVAVYPSPARGHAFVELSFGLGREAVAAVLVDALGRVVRAAVLPAQGAVAHELDLTELAGGVYALRLHTSAGLVIRRLVVE